jgi:uncharacterized membrane protein YbaN (DUF454 family)
VNHDEAKEILLFHRPDTADADDPQIAEALELAKREPELARWLEEHVARQDALREKFRQIVVPAGLKEQIISEHAAEQKIIFWRKNFTFAATAAMASLIVLMFFWFRPSPKDDTLAIYESRMAGVALRGYAMDLKTNDVTPIRNFLAQNHAPSDFALPDSLQKISIAGCAVENWQNAKVSMICFRTGKPLPPGEQSDLWLFVVDGSAVKNAPADGSPQFSKISRLAVAVWVQGDKLYLLGAEGDEQMVRKLL